MIQLMAKNPRQKKSCHGKMPDTFRHYTQKYNTQIEAQLSL